MPTNSPWDGTSWDVTAPDIDQPIGNHYKEMYDLRKGVGIRMDKEHITLAGSSAGGEHVQGSARAWFQDAVPALQPDGTALAATDNGMLWFDTNSTPDNLAYVLVDHSDPTVGNGWVLLSTSIFAEMVLLAHQWAEVQTFDKQTVHTLGLLANGPIVGSVDGDIALNTDKFTVDAETGNTTVAGTLDVGGAAEVVGIATLGDASTLKTSAPPTADAEIANKKYVDDNSIRAWVQFSSAGNINGTGSGVASVVRNSIGSYTITWSTAFADADYAVNATPFGTNNTSGRLSTISTTAVQVVTEDIAAGGSNADSACCVMAIGNQ